MKRFALLIGLLLVCATFFVTVPAIAGSGGHIVDTYVAEEAVRQIGAHFEAAPGPFTISTDE